MLRGRRWGYLILVALIAWALWPSPDPLAGVQTVALAPAEEDVAAEVFQGLELALGDRRIRIVSDEAEADAVIRIEPRSARVEIDENGLRAVVRCLVTRDGRQSVLELRVTVDAQGLRAELVRPSRFGFGV